MPLVLKPRKRVSEIDFDKVNAIAEELKLSPLTAQILYNRGYATAEECREFLYPDETALLNPFDILNMDKLVEKINSAEKITVYGDYDCDGVCATVIMLTALKRIGKTVSYYIPHRVREGYGLNKPATDKLFSEGCDLMVTVDCGISSVELIRELTDAGHNICVTDHHTVGDELPPCVVVNPHQSGDSYKNRELCGAGIAFKVAQALLGSGADDLMDLAGIATMADVVSLRGENRYLAKRAVEMLNSSPRPAFKALIDAAGIKDEITAQKAQFNIIPRINAVGRIDDAQKTVEFLLSSENLAEQAAEFNEINARRQRLCDDIMADAHRQIEENALQRKYKALVLQSENWSLGVIGICAAKLAEEYSRPCILFSVNGDMANGSARSVDGIDLYGLLKSASDMLVRFGGHKMAAGLGCRTENIPALTARLDETLRQAYDLRLFYPTAKYDARAEINDITEDAVRSLNLLQPCGCDNEEVLLRIDGCEISELKTMGALNNHLRMKISDKSGSASGVVFGFASAGCDFFNISRASFIAAPSLNVWNGRTDIQLLIKNAKESENINPRHNAEALTSAFYSRLFYEKTGKSRITFINEREELEYSVSEWSDEDNSGTLILCDHPEYAAECIRLLENEAPRFDISYYSPLNRRNGFNSLVIGCEEVDFTQFRRVLLFDFLNPGYADYIAALAPEIEIYACARDLSLFDTVFEEYKALTRENMTLAYKALCNFTGSGASRRKLLEAVSAMSNAPQPVLSVALDTFRELGFLTLKDDFSIEVNKAAAKRSLSESTFYSKMLKCVTRKSR